MSSSTMLTTGKFAYFGTPCVSSETLAELIEAGFIPSLVVTSPDAPQGRGLVLTPSPTKVLATTNSIPVFTPEKLDVEAIASIAAYGCEYALVVAFGKIFPETLIDSFEKGVLNVHYSLLPRHRGATPLEAALIAGDSETGVTIQKMVKALDAGDIIAQESTRIEPDETARELRPRLIALGAELLVRTLPKYIAGEIIHAPQDGSLATHSGKLKKEDGLLVLSAPAQDNWNRYRAFADSIGTFFMKNEKRIKINKASLNNNEFVIERVTPEGKNEMSYLDFKSRS